MDDKVFAKEIMNKIRIIQEYKDRYGDDDINEYVLANGTYKGIEVYLIQKMRDQETQKHVSVDNNNT